MKTLTRYIKNKLLWCSGFSRGHNSIYDGLTGRYIMDNTGDVYYYPYSGESRVFLGHID